MNTSSLAEPRRYGAVNWLGLWNLYLKEVRRFLNIFTQTVAAPVVTTLLFLAVFSMSLGRAVEVVNGVPFLTFLAPGLIMMTMVQNAFANTSSSLVISKVQGNIVDVLMPPISPGEFVAAYALGGMSRGVVVGLATGLVMLLFADLSIHNPFLVLFHGLSASLMLALLGLLGGLWSEKFDHIAAITNFIIMPLSFLSGTFYSISRLPETLHTIAFFNPFFYMIDGFRGGFIGHFDVNPLLGVGVLIGMNVFLWGVAWGLVARGYRLKN